MEHEWVVFSGDPGFAGGGSGHRSSFEPPQNLTKYISFSSSLHVDYESNINFLKACFNFEKTITTSKNEKNAKTRNNTYLYKLINQKASEHFNEHESLIFYLFWALNRPIQPCFLLRRRRASLELFQRELEQFELGFGLLWCLEKCLMQ
jgi:hypothetical protein